MYKKGWKIDRQCDDSNVCLFLCFVKESVWERRLFGEIELWMVLREITGRRATSCLIDEEQDAWEQNTIDELVGKKVSAFPPIVKWTTGGAGILKVPPCIGDHKTAPSSNHVRQTFVA